MIGTLTCYQEMATTFIIKYKMISYLFSVLVKFQRAYTMERRLNQKVQNWLLSFYIYEVIEKRHNLFNIIRFRNRFCSSFNDFCFSSSAVSNLYSPREDLSFGNKKKSIGTKSGAYRRISGNIVVQHYSFSVFCYFSDT